MGSAPPEAEVQGRFFALSSDFCCLVSLDGVLEASNPTFGRVLGYAPEELRRIPIAALLHPDDCERTLRAIAAIEKTPAHELRGLHNRYRCKDGSFRVLSWRATFDRDTRTVYAVGRDVTDEQRAVEELRASEGRYRQLLEQASDAILVMDSQRRFTLTNPAAQALLGYSEEELRGLTLENVLPPEQSWTSPERQAALRAGKNVLSVRGLRRKDGSLVQVEISTALRADGSFQGIARDVTERLRMEDALRRSEEALKTVVANAPLVLFATDAQGRFTLCVGKQLEAMGLRPEMIVGQSVFDLYAERPWIVQAMRRVLAGQPTTSAGESRGRMFETHYRPLLDPGGAVAGAIGVAIDVTERTRLEAQLLVSDRMASLGRLAAGVAHEINNPLAFTVSNLDVVSRDLELLAEGSASTDVLEQLRAAVRDARVGAERVRKTVRDLKLLTRSEERTAAVDVLAVLESSVHMAGNEIRHRARLVKELAPVPPVLGDDARMGQVFLNLLMNAVQAIPEGQVEDHEIRVRTLVGPGGEVVIEVADTGAGVPPEIRSRLFDPFFTTKAVGVGTGLGLSICHGIISAMAGRIELESAVGKGSVFRVVLPAAPAELPLAPPADLKPGPAKTLARARVLVVDDEPAIGTAIRRTLAAHDVSVLTNPREVLERVDAGAQFDVIFCDLMMPDLTGMDLHAEILRRSPELAARMVFMTGGAFSPRARQFLSKTPNRRVEKPFTVRDLETVLADVMADRPG